MALNKSRKKQPCKLKLKIQNISIPSSMDRNAANEHHVIEIASTGISNPVYQLPQQNRVVVNNNNNNNNNNSPRPRPAARQRNPLNSGRWICMELLLLVGQITAAIVVLVFAKEESPRVPLRVYIIGYAAGCVAILPILYWRFRNRNHVWEQDHLSSQSQLQMESSQENENNVGLTPRQVLGLEGENGDAPQTNGVLINPRHRRHVEYFKLFLDFFFAVWFVLGIVWIFGGYTSDTDAPYLYRLCVAFLGISFVGYAMPFLLCATICCCLPCIISALGVREDFGQSRGATRDSINALPTYKFEVKKINTSGNDHGEENSTLGAGTEGGIVAAGTDKERAISAEDAVCCICLADYVNNDELRELPCSHFFHKECIDQWLQINALCPLCKGEAGQTARCSSPEATANIQNG